jgi:hypothetical protein
MGRLGEDDLRSNQTWTRADLPRMPHCAARFRADETDSERWPFMTPCLDAGVSVPADCSIPFV